MVSGNPRPYSTVCSPEMGSVKDIRTLHVACRLENHSVLVYGTCAVLVCHFALEHIARL